MGFAATKGAFALAETTLAGPAICFLSWDASTTGVGLVVVVVTGTF